MSAMFVDTTPLPRKVSGVQWTHSTRLWNELNVYNRRMLRWGGGAIQHFNLGFPTFFSEKSSFKLKTLHGDVYDNCYTWKV